MNKVYLIGAVAAFGLCGCEDFNRPISTGGFDPLGTPGGMRATADSMDGFRGGQFVHAIMDNTVFFFNRPKGDVDADKLLRRGTSMKVISQSDNYVKVELDSGEIGFVPAIMLVDPNRVPDAGVYGNPGDYQVYPPIEAANPLPAGEMPPEGAIPTVIDPEAPASDIPIPPLNPLPKLPPTPTPETGAGVVEEP